MRNGGAPVICNTSASTLPLPPHHTTMDGVPPWRNSKPQDGGPSFTPDFLALLPKVPGWGKRTRYCHHVRREYKVTLGAGDTAADGGISVACNVVFVVFVNRIRR